jgi:hypothetical protein
VAPDVKILPCRKVTVKHGGTHLSYVGHVVPATRVGKRWFVRGAAAHVSMRNVDGREIEMALQPSGGLGATKIKQESQGMPPVDRAGWRETWFQLDGLIVSRLGDYYVVLYIDDRQAAIARVEITEWQSGTDLNP